MTTYYLIDDNEELMDAYEGDYCCALDYAREIGAAYALDEQEYQDLLNGEF
ncbi:MAG: hypothetical protein IJQ81_03435 [Oscillibacter sp.]|nr:hypothetical protein [Oscillibacter sp.]